MSSLLITDGEISSTEGRGEETMAKSVHFGMQRGSNLGLKYLFYVQRTSPHHPATVNCKVLLIPMYYYQGFCTGSLPKLPYRCIANKSSYTTGNLEATPHEIFIIWWFKIVLKRWQGLAFFKIYSVLFSSCALSTVSLCSQELLVSAQPAAYLSSAGFFFPVVS